MSPTTLLRIARILRAVRVLRPSAAQRIPATKTVQCSKQEWKFVMLIYSMKEDNYLLVSSYSRFKEETKKVHNLELQQKVQSKSASNSSMIKILERETEKLRNYGLRRWLCRCGLHNCSLLFLLHGTVTAASFTLFTSLSARNSKNSSNGRRPSPPCELLALLHLEERAFPRILLLFVCSCFVIIFFVFLNLPFQSFAVFPST